MMRRWLKCRFRKLGHAGPVVAMLLVLASSVLASNVLATGRAGAAELLMLEQPGCVWCVNWHKQIGPIYPKTAEGRRAPLRRVNIRQAWPADLAGIRSDIYTPTFVLIENGVEIDRIRGFPGEDFFWGLLTGMIEKLPAGAQPDAGATKKGPELSGPSPYGPVNDGPLHDLPLERAAPTGDVQASLSHQLRP